VRNHKGGDHVEGERRWAMDVLWIILVVVVVLALLGFLGVR